MSLNTLKILPKERSTDAGPIWSFRTDENIDVGNPPYTPSEPQPLHASTNLELGLTLSWKGGDPDTGDQLTYDILFGTQTPPVQKLAIGLSSTNHEVSNVKPFFSKRTRNTGLGTKVLDLPGRKSLWIQWILIYTAL